MSEQPLRLFLYCFRDYDEKKYFDELQAERGFNYEHTTAYPSLENADLAAGFDAVSITPCAITAELLKRYHQLGVRYILTRSIGFDHIDLDAAKSLDMHVSHVAYPPAAVAEYTLMLMLMSLRKMPYIMAQAAAQDFSLPNKMGRTLGNSTVGIIATGQIGRAVIQLLSSFGCRILAYDPYQNEGLQGLCEYVDLPTLYAQSDVISLHAPATDNNFHLIDQAAFEQMKANVVIINTSRGTLIDTDALIGALESGQVAAAALDVLEDETGLYYRDLRGEALANRQLALLRSFPNVILTPHTAFYTEETNRGMAVSTVDCLFDMASGTANPLVII